MRRAELLESTEDMVERVRWESLRRSVGCVAELFKRVPVSPVERAERVDDKKANLLVPQPRICGVILREV